MAKLKLPICSRETIFWVLGMKDDHDEVLLADAVSSDREGGTTGTRLPMANMERLKFVGFKTSSPHSERPGLKTTSLGQS